MFSETGKGGGIMIQKGAEPFFLRGGSHGVLLLHGFTGSPADLLLLGQSLQRQGMTVLAPRIAGHGTTEEDLSRQTGEDFLDSARDGYALLTGCCKKVSVVGHSMGGVLAFLLAAECKVHRIVSLATPVFIAPERGADQLPPLKFCRGRYVPKHRRPMKNVPDAVNETYLTMPLVSIHELFGLMHTMTEQLGRVDRPTLILHSLGDHTADPKSAAYLAEHIATERKDVIYLKRSGHLLPLDKERDKVFALTAKFLLGKYHFRKHRHAEETKKPQETEQRRSVTKAKD